MVILFKVLKWVSDKILAPIAPILLASLIVTSIVSCNLYKARESSLKQVAELQLIVKTQSAVVESCREDKDKLDKVLTESRQSYQELQDSKCSSVSTLSRLATKPNVKKSPVQNTEENEVNDYEVLNMRLGDATLRLLNEAAGVSSN